MIRSLLVTVAIGVLAPPAQAHTMPLRQAEAKARSEALLIAGRLEPRPRVSVRGCDRVSRHVVDCMVRYRRVSNGREVGRCMQTVRVRYVSRARNLRASFPRPPRC